LQVSEARITCRLPDKPPAPGAELAVTAIDPPYFNQEIGGAGLKG
jgi:hypothetical protein